MVFRAAPGEPGVVFAPEPGVAGQAGERETQGPDHWKDLHTTCPASSLEYGTTEGYVWSSGKLLAWVGRRGCWWAEACCELLGSESPPPPPPHTGTELGGALP